MLISLEGSEGVGKSTLFSLLQKDVDFHKLIKDKYSLNIIFSKEPTNSISGQFFKETFLSGKEHPYSTMTEILSLLLDRSMNVDLLPQSEDNLIIMDRFIDSTCVYQLILNESVNQDMCSDLIKLFDLSYKYILGRKFAPKKTIYFECPIETSIKRVNKRNSIHSDINDFKDETFFQDIINSYELIMKFDPDRFIRLNTDTTLNKSYLNFKDIIIDIVCN